MKAAACALLLTGIIGAWEPPEIYLSLNSLYGTAADFRHTADAGLTLEETAYGFSYLARLHYRQAREDHRYSGDQDILIGDLDYADMRSFGFQTALRRHPFEWMPGFFTEALIGYENIRARSRYEPWNPPEEWDMSLEMYRNSIPYQVRSTQNHTVQTGAGFGYVWEFARARVSLGFVLGSEFLFRNSALATGKVERSHDMIGSLLRFNQLEMGYAF